LIATNLTKNASAFVVRFVAIQCVGSLSAEVDRMLSISFRASKRISLSILRERIRFMSHRTKRTLPAEVLAASASSAVTLPVTNRLPQGTTIAAGNLEPVIQKAWPHFQAGQYDKALGVLASGDNSPQIHNARGVCLLRLGRYEEAVRLYRGLVLHAGGTWSKSDVPTHFKTNFATALLLHGHASGCYSMLGEIDNESHPAVIRLRQAIKKWQAGLKFSHRLNWWFGRIDPPHCHVSIDFPPGDLTDAPSEMAPETLLPLSAYPPSVEQR